MMETIKLKSGYRMPVIGFGTWRLKGEECFKAVSTALSIGYTHIDTAAVYGNEKEVGKAIKDLNRSKLFITSKVFYFNLKHDDVVKSCEQTLNDLETDYVDLYLMHWPNKNIPLKETMAAMQELAEQGKIRSFGVSNFTVAHLKEAISIGNIPVCVNQIEYHPYLGQEDVLEFCRQNSIVVEAFCPNAQGKVIDDPVLQRIGRTYKRTAAQVSQKWLLQKGMVVLPKSRSEKHMKENLDMFGWELSEEDMKRIGSLNRNERMCLPDFAEFDRKG